MIISINNLSAIRKKHSEEKLVLTSGTFDLLHTGHLNYLEAVKKRGDAVVVLLSSDARVKARKGPGRPVINQSQRARMLDGLRSVDYVFIDPSKLDPSATDPVHAEIIQDLQPDYYVTDGPDPRFLDLMDSSKFIILGRLPGPSTTSIIERIRRQPE
jgi:rfaE bifunctional protein nucleotidyltransferase chain/domain